MSHRDYTDTGVRIMQSTAGDLMLLRADGTSLHIPAQEVEDSFWHERAAYLIIRHIIRFVRGNGNTEAKPQGGTSGEEA